MNPTELQALASAQGITLDPLLLVDYPVGTWFWAIHHEVVAEQLTEPLANRIECILTEKSADERKIRLAALRPVKNPKALAPTQKAYDKATAAARKAYAKAAAPAWKAYDEAFASAQKAYYEAIAPAQKAYNEATTAAWMAYREAVAAARKAYDEAIAPAQKAYYEATTTQWATEYPDHPKWSDGGLVLVSFDYTSA